MTCLDLVISCAHADDEAPQPGHLLDGIAPTEALQNLKRKLLRPDAMQEWDLRRLLDHFKPRVTPEANELIEALSAAISD